MFKAKIRVFLKKAYLMLLQYLSEKCTEIFPEKVSRLLNFFFFFRTKISVLYLLLSVDIKHVILQSEIHYQKYSSLYNLTFLNLFIGICLKKPC